MMTGVAETLACNAYIYIVYTYLYGCFPLNTCFQILRKNWGIEVLGHTAIVYSILQETNRLISKAVPSVNPTISMNEYQLFNTL